MTGMKKAFLWPGLAVVGLIAGASIGIAIEHRVIGALGPALLFTNGDLRLNAYDDWTLKRESGLAVYDTLTRFEFVNVSGKSITIRVPPQDAMVGFDGSCARLELGDDQADKADVVLAPGEVHTIRRTTTTVMTSSGGPSYGLVYYQIAVYIDGRLQIMGAKSEFRLL